MKALAYDSSIDALDAESFFFFLFPVSFLPSRPVPCRQLLARPLYLAPTHRRRRSSSGRPSLEPRPRRLSDCRSPVRTRARLSAPPHRIDTRRAPSLPPDPALSRKGGDRGHKGVPRETDTGEHTRMPTIKGIVEGDGSAGLLMRTRRRRRRKKNRGKGKCWNRFMTGLEWRCGRLFCRLLFFFFFFSPPHRRRLCLLQAKYPDLYLYEGTPIWKAAWRVAKDCVAVQRNGKLWTFTTQVPAVQQS